MKNSEKLNLPLEIKALNAREFDGHGSIFGNVDLGGDIILPGAFKRTLAQHKKAGDLPQMFWMHQMDRVPGKWLDMKEDDEGLAVKGVLAETDLGDEMHVLLGMKAVRGLSIGYQTIDMDFDSDGNRLLKEVELWEVSIVSLPMNPMAQIAHAKSRLSADGVYVPTAREFEQFLRRGGCSKAVSKRITGMILDASGATPDADDDEVNDQEAGGTLVTIDPNRRDADEEAEALKALENFRNELLAERINKRCG